LLVPWYPPSYGTGTHPQDCDPYGQMPETVGGSVASGATHYLEEADQLADRVAVLDHGRLIAQGTPDPVAVPDSLRDARSL
jgi:hypothetical protein